MTSKTGKTASEIKITYDFDNHKIETEAVGTTLDKVSASF